MWKTPLCWITLSVDSVGPERWTSPVSKSHLSWHCYSTYYTTSKVICVVYRKFSSEEYHYYVSDDTNPASISFRQPDIICWSFQGIFWDHERQQSIGRDWHQCFIWCWSDQIHHTLLQDQVCVMKDTHCSYSRACACVCLVNIDQLFLCPSYIINRCEALCIAIRQLGTSNKLHLF